jgi:hypothetical protein
MQYLTRGTHLMNMIIYCVIINYFHNKKMKSGILNVDPLTKVDMEWLNIPNENNKHIKIKKISL